METQATKLDQAIAILTKEFESRPIFGNMVDRPFWQNPSDPFGMRYRLENLVTCAVDELTPSEAFLLMRREGFKWDGQHWIRVRISKAFCGTGLEVDQKITEFEANTGFKCRGVTTISGGGFNIHTAYFKRTKLQPA